MKQKKTLLGDSSRNVRKKGSLKKQGKEKNILNLLSGNEESAKERKDKEKEMLGKLQSSWKSLKQEKGINQNELEIL